MKAEKQLFCFPFAGGSASFFDVLRPDLPEAEIISQDYPGHGSRRSEKLCTEISQVADDAFSFLRSRLSGEDYALLGYSMGTIIAVEVLRRICADNDIKPPVCVFLAAHKPVTDHGISMAEQSDDYVIERTVGFGAISQEIASGNVFRRLYLPLYRADYSMIGRYRFEDLDARFRLPLTVFYSPTDTPLEEVRGWTDFFTEECGFYQFSGDHLFLREHHEEIAGIIRSKLFLEDLNDF